MFSNAWVQIPQMTTDHYAPVHTVSEQPMAQSNMRYHEQAHLRIVSLLLFSIDLQGFGRDILITRSARQFARVV
ncbi:hypothetical protein PsorP6_019012 [Peronosclerospora sorghi]|nr:hypothetical protein PsorP6_018998 [Peronosclerospora sorghi]KAI9895137.1 hypothetical protein PsorP6_019012 [Peronosclerospora sorghi]